MKEIRIEKHDKPEIKEIKSHMLLTGMSVPQMSKKTGFDSTTIYRWLNTGTFLRWKMLTFLRRLRGESQSR